MRVLENWRKCVSCGRYMSFDELEKATVLYDSASIYATEPSDTPHYMHKECRQGRSMTKAINLLMVQEWEHTCPACGAITTRHSIDGGLTSVFQGECGHSWVCCPFALGGKEEQSSYNKRLGID